jgi:hypothetical protein
MRHAFICALLLALGVGSATAQHRPPQREIPFNQTITVGDLSVTVEQYQNTASAGILVNIITTTTDPAANVLVMAIVETADGNFQQCFAMADARSSWNRDGSFVVAVPAKAPVTRVLNMLVIPVTADEIHRL